MEFINWLKVLSNEFTYSFLFLSAAIAVYIAGKIYVDVRKNSKRTKYEHDSTKKLEILAKEYHALSETTKHNSIGISEINDKLNTTVLNNIHFANELYKIVQKYTDRLDINNPAHAFIISYLL